jgi:hypothetical protein
MVQLHTMNSSTIAVYPLCYDQRLHHRYHSHQLLFPKKSIRMKKLKPILLTLALIITLTSCARRTGVPLAEDAPPDHVPSILGEFALNGFDPQGNEYGGRLTITQAGEGAYHLQWIVSDSIQEGTGILTGNQLEVTWQTIKGFPVQLSGAARYTITTAGELYGTKTVDGQTGEGTEMAYPNAGENMNK